MPTMDPVVVGIPKIDATIKELTASMPGLFAQAMYTSAIHILKPAIQARIRQNRSVFRGQLFQRIGARVVQKTGAEPSIELGAIGVPYSLAVELGAPPHSPDAAKLMDYVQKKMGFKGKEALEVYAAVYETIRDKGTIPHPYVMPVWEAAQSIWLADVLARVKARLEKT